MRVLLLTLALLSAPFGAEAQTFINGATQTGITGTIGIDQTAPGTTNGVVVNSSALPTNASTAANQSSQIAALGTTADTAYPGTGTASIIGALKGLYNATLAPLATGSNVIGSTTLRATGTNRSASVTTTASTLMAANTGRQGWKIKNDCTVAVVINFDATATAAAGSGNMQIPAGGYMSNEPGFVETGPLSVIAASGTCALTAREY